MAELAPSDDDEIPTNKRPRRSRKQTLLFGGELLAASLFLGAATIITVGGFLHEHPDPWNAIGGILWMLGSLVILVVLLLAWYWKTTPSFRCPLYKKTGSS